MPTRFIKLKDPSKTGSFSYSLWAPPLALDTVSHEEVYVIHHKVPHRPSGERNEDQQVEFHLRAECSFFFVLSYSLGFFFSLCLSRISFPLRSGYKTNKAWPRGGKQPPKVRPHRKNGVSGKEGCRWEADDPHENWGHPAIAWVTRFTCSPIKKEGR